MSALSDKMSKENAQVMANPTDPVSHRLFEFIPLLAANIDKIKACDSCTSPFRRRIHDPMALATAKVEHLGRMLIPKFMKRRAFRHQLT